MFTPRHRLLTPRLDVSLFLLFMTLFNGLCFAEEQKVPLPSETLYTNVVTPRGLQPNQSFVAGDIDSIDTNSGNLTLRVPLGQTYEVGPILSYQILAVNNSNAWDHIPVGCPAGGCPAGLPERTFALTNPATNAGVGWEVHFGRLHPRQWPRNLEGEERRRWPVKDGDSADHNTHWMYMAPDGARHMLYELDGRDNGTNALPIRYSKDGSFLRLRQVNGSTVHIEEPNGVYSVFKKTADSTGTVYCNGRFASCWRFAEKRDAYGNFMKVSYSSLGDTETWAISDSAGRSHKIVFDKSDDGTAGGDGGLSTDPFVTDERDEWGDLRRVVDWVEVAAFDGLEGDTAVYDFTYDYRTMSRACPQDAIHIPSNANRITMPVLQSISVPNSQPYRFETWASDGGPNTDCFSLNGRVKEVILPTLGKVSYNYSPSWRNPTQCVFVNDDFAEFDYNVTAVSARHTYKPNYNQPGTYTLEGTTTYSSDLRSAAPLILDGPDCTRADYRRTEVNHPEDGDGNRVRTVFYHAVTQGPRYPTDTNPILQYSPADNGLPFTKNISIGNTVAKKKFLSRDTFHCVGGSCDLKRRKFVRYTYEWRQCNTSTVHDSPGCYQVNPLVHKELTQYKDDNNKWMEHQYSRYDGAGHFGRVISRDNFAGSTTTRKVTTSYSATGGQNFNPNTNSGIIEVGHPINYLPGPSQPWILTPFTKKVHEDSGRAYTTEYQFNNKGSITCTRAWQNQGGRSTQDRVVKLTLGSSPGTNLGLPIKEIVSGGETAAIGTGSLCNVDLRTNNGQSFTFDHGYQFLTLSSTRIGTFPYRYQADIDSNTGLLKRTYDVSGLKTDLVYDRLGRLRFKYPESNLGEASTEFRYQNLANSLPQIVTFRREGSTVLSKKVEVMDHFGRSIQEIIQRPVGDSSFSNSWRKTTYDHVGQVRSKSTLQASGSFDLAKSWRHSKYDAFGRPGKIKAPDGQEEIRTYWGDRLVRSNVSVRTSLNGSNSVSTYTHRDGKGRVVQVANPEYRTVFEYDPYDQKVKSTRIGGGLSQSRTYGWDARGIKLSENLPELGGNGSQTFLPDALGQPRQITNARNSLKYEYDGAGRLVKVKDAVSSLAWEDWTYGTHNAGQDYRKGKVVKAVRHNYPVGGNADWTVSEDYEYKGKLGQVSKKTLQQQFPTDPFDPWGVTFEQNMVNDALGNLISETYPTCVVTPQDGDKECNDGNDLVAPSHTVTRTYNRGFLRAVDSDLNPSASPWALFDFHPNLQLRKTTYSNGILGSFNQGTNGMVRPSQILYEKNGSYRWGTGAFSYDGTGNIHTMGNDHYYYDKASRLVYGELHQAAAHAKEQYTYDALDNLRSRSRDGGAFSVFNFDTDHNLFLSESTSIPQNTFYDEAGNTTSVSFLPGTQTPRWEMEYDGLNKQTRFKDNTVIPGNPEFPQDFKYLYGPGNLRLISMDKGGKRTYRLRGMDGKVLREITVVGWGAGGSWNHQKDFIYGADGLVATRDRTGTRKFFLRDHLGSTRAITNASGNVTETLHFYPFGAKHYGSGDGEEVAMFTGHERDPSGLSDYMMQRTYLYPLYRFAQVDPARDGWNLYAYARNNPMKFTDPNGLAGIEYDDVDHLGPIGMFLYAVAGEYSPLAWVEKGVMSTGAGAMAMGGALVGDASLGIVRVITAQFTDKMEIHLLDAGTDGSLIPLTETVAHVSVPVFDMMTVSWFSDSLQPNPEAPEVAQQAFENANEQRKRIEEEH